MNLWMGALRTRKHWRTTSGHSRNYRRSHHDDLLCFLLLCSSHCLINLLFAAVQIVQAAETSSFTYLCPLAHDTFQCCNMCLQIRNKPTTFELWSLGKHTTASHADVRISPIVSVLVSSALCARVPCSRVYVLSTNPLRSALVSALSICAAVNVWLSSS
jgi:hypothetical protein